MKGRSRFVRAGEPALVTIPNVAVLEVGMDWETSTGVFTWTEDDLKSAVASYDDPAVRTPVLKLGHTDPRFDGQPAFGRLMNPRLSDNEQTLFADYVGVPVWLAKVMPSAYPRRSIEGWFDMKTRTGHDWPFVLTACALLGESYPAIMTLDDIEACYGEEPPPLVAAANVPEVLASRETEHGRFICAVQLDKNRERVTMGKQGNEVKASGVSVSDLVRAFYDTYDGPDYYWWWIREVRVNPQELIVDDDEDGLWRIPWTVATDDTIVFGDAVQVEIEYVDVAAAADGTPVRVAASYETAKAAKRPTRDGMQHGHERPATMAANGKTKETAGMQLSDEAITALGLDPKVATEDEVNAAVLASVEADPGGGGDDGDKETGDKGGDKPSEETAPGGAAPAGTPPEVKPDTGGTTDTATTTNTVPEGMALVDASMLEQLKAGAQAGLTLMEQTKVAARNHILDEAVKAGKFPPVRREHYEKMMIADPEGTTAVIASLEPGLIPVMEHGYEGGDDVGGKSAAAYPDEWKPSVAKANRHSGGGVRITVANDK